MHTSPVVRLLALAGVLIACLTRAADAAPAREIQWDDLIPAELVSAGQKVMAMQDRVTRLPDDQRAVYEEVGAEMLLRERIAKGEIARADLLDDERALLEDAPGKRHPGVVKDLEAMVAARMHANSLASAVEPTLNGARVRLPGYVLPLEFDGTRVREFLLVPFIGACIHVPAPPPNQMVFVRSATGFDVPELYAPVWVEGTMVTGSITRDLYLVDGESTVEAGYSLDAEKVEAFE